MKKLFTFALALCLTLALGVSALAASGEPMAAASGETAAPASVVVEGASITAEVAGWMYTQEDGVITVIQSPQNVKRDMVVLLPGSMLRRIRRPKKICAA